jgi:hypothetical protein
MGGVWERFSTAIKIGKYPLSRVGSKEITAALFAWLNSPPVSWYPLWRIPWIGPDIAILFALETTRKAGGFKILHLSFEIRHF